MTIYTRTGDQGETSLGNGIRVRKDDSRIELVGEIDELNSVLGLACSFIKSKETSKILENIQKDLFIIGTIVSESNSTVLHRTVENTHIYLSKRVTEFEKIIDSLDKKLLTLKNFILPGGTAGASFLHLARSVCRRVERRLVEMGHKSQRETEEILVYFNRLSDLLFTLARNENRKNKVREKIWKK